MPTYVKLFSASDEVKIELDGDNQGDGANYGARLKGALGKLTREIGESMSAVPEEFRPRRFEVVMRIKATPNDGLAIVSGPDTGHFKVKISWGDDQAMDLTNLLGP